MHRAVEKCNICNFLRFKEIDDQNGLLEISALKLNFGICGILKSTYNSY